MQLQVILNYVEHYKGFVYKRVRWRAWPCGRVRRDARGRAEASGPGRSGPGTNRLWQHTRSRRSLAGTEILVPAVLRDGTRRPPWAAEDLDERQEERSRRNAGSRPQPNKG